MGRAGTSVQLIGERRLRTTLHKAGVDLSDLTAANKQVAGVVAAATRYTRRTGRLAGSVRPGGTRASAIVRAGGSAVPYAGVQEYGWDAHHIRPQSAIRDAAITTRPSWLDLYLARIKRVLSTVKGA